MTSRFVRMGIAAAAAVWIAAGASPAVAQQSGGTSHALDRANLDTTCAPCTDFFTFANGGWEKRTEIPAAYSSWGSFNELQDHNQDVVHQILDDQAAAVRDKKAKPGTNEWKVGTFYAACMDTTAIEALGTKPIDPMMREVASIGDTKALLASLGKLDAQTGVAPFGFFVRPDTKNSSEEIANAGQGGLGLPEREYYFRTDDKSKALRDAYVAHVGAMLQLSGESAADASADAQKIMDLETKMAQASMPRVAMRDPNATYHKMSLAEMQKLTPDLDLQGMMRTMGAPAVTEINVAQPDFFRAIDTLLITVPVDTWKAYLRWHVLANAANALPSKFANENFKWSQRLTGVQEQLPRWKRCAATSNGVLGEAIGQEYVKRTFTPAAKARALKMVDNLIATLRADIGQLAWMSDATKKQAIIKLDAFTRKIGYPDKWKDYSKLEVETGQYLENLRHANDWRRADNWSRLGKPVDRTEWGMTPPTVNAYYNPQMNEIVFPAGILQPPFFDPSADDAVNYGAMGAVIGHEMTHGFDDEGRQFDPQGNLRDWWTAEDAAKYDAQAKLVVDQFDSYTVLDSSTHVNGKLTEGENIADLGGLKIAYLAMEKSLQEKGRPGLIDGFTPEQRFFLGWAQVWREETRPEMQRTLVHTNEHAPAKWRVDGPFSNMPEFKAAWGCKDGDPMVRPDSLRAHIW
ncbi:MAG TPA: M13 family metallopeptidase [Gemmatimonadaceae bacterium]|nr:M13 family metallopeptidase [Gemmatimonadaceae bacterium]